MPPLGIPGVCGATVPLGKVLGSAVGAAPVGWAPVGRADVRLAMMDETKGLIDAEGTMEVMASLEMPEVKLCRAEE